MRSRILLLIGLITIAGVPVRADEPAKTDALVQAFEKLKAMAGEWEVATASEGVPKSSVTYRVIGGGSAVLETLFAGSEMEMVSIYHRDGKELVMTHYCCVGNQPRFKGRIDEKTGELVLDFTGGTNLDPAKDGHIHGGRIRFKDKDNVASEWLYYVGGKKAETHALTLKRKK